MSEESSDSTLEAFFLRWPALFSGKAQVIVTWGVTLALIATATAIAGHLVTGRLYPWETLGGFGTGFVGLYSSVIGIILAFIGLVRREGRRSLAAVAISFGGLVLSLLLFGFVERGPTHRYAWEQQGLAVQEIVRTVMQDPTYLTPEVHAEFWRLIRGDTLSPDELAQVRENFTDLTAPYMRLFFQDALESYRSGQPVKSRARAEYEQAILARGIIGQSRIEANDMMMKKIAARELVVDGEREVMFDEETITAALENVDNSLRALDILFTDPKLVWNQGAEGS